MPTRQGVFPSRPVASRVYLETSLTYARGSSPSLGKHSANLDLMCLAAKEPPGFLAQPMAALRRA